MLTFDRDTHTYRWNGSPVVNVTRITEGLNSYAGVPADILARAADRGDAVHYATELFDQDDLDLESLPDEIRGYLGAWIEFRADTGFIPTHIEQRVFSAKFRYAGTLDRAGTFRNLKGVKPADLCLLDIKATASIMPAVGPQTAAYATAFAEHVGVAVRHRFAVQLKPNGTYHLQHLTDSTDFSVFASALSIYAWRERYGMKEKEPA